MLRARRPFRVALRVIVPVSTPSALEQRADVAREAGKRPVGHAAAPLRFSGRVSYTGIDREE